MEQIFLFNWVIDVLILILAYRTLIDIFHCILLPYYPLNKRRRCMLQYRVFLMKLKTIVICSLKHSKMVSTWFNCKHIPLFLLVFNGTMWWTLSITIYLLIIFSSLQYKFLALKLKIKMCILTTITTLCITKFIYIMY